MTAGLTLASAPVVATVWQGSLSTYARAAATVQQQGALSASAPAMRSHREAADYSTQLWKSDVLLRDICFFGKLSKAAKPSQHSN